MYGSCSQSQIMKQFRNLPASVVEYFKSSYTEGHNQEIIVEF